MRINRLQTLSFSESDTQAEKKEIGRLLTSASDRLRSHPAEQISSPVDQLLDNDPFGDQLSRVDVTTGFGQRSRAIAL